MASVIDRPRDDTLTVRLLALAKRTGYEILQTNGQRKYGPPPFWKGPPPPKGSEVFIGKLPRDLYEDELVPLFEKSGKIYEMRLMMDFSGSTRGFGFVQFTNPREAEKAVTELNNYEVRPNRFIGVVKSVDNCRLFVGGLPKNKTKQEIEVELNKYVEGITDVILYSSVVDKSKSRGFAFVEFENHRLAAMARRKLIPGRVCLWDHEIQIDWAIPENDVDEETMSKVKILYVRNLMLSTTEQTIWNAMESVTGHERLERVKKMRDFAFVHFTDRESAKAAMDFWHRKELEGSILEVTWAKPIQKGVQRYSKRTLRRVYPEMEYVYPAATYHPHFMNVYSGRGTQGSPHMQSPGSWRSSGTYVTIPSPVVGTRSCTTAREVLSEYCLKNNWGEPIFNIMPIKSMQDNEVYMCRVTIPHYPGDQAQFQTPRVSLSAEEAKMHAAEVTHYVLSSLGQSAFYPKEYSHTPVVPPGHAMAQPPPAPFPAGNRIPAQPEITVAYGLPPTQAPAYLVHGKVGGYDTQYYDSQYPVQM